MIRQIAVHLICLELALEKAIEMVTDSISCYVVDPVSHMTRKRKVPADRVIKLLILKQGKSIRAEICEQMPEGEEFQVSAFCMQRYKIKHEAIIRVLNLFNRMVKPKRTFNGYYLISCDGSDVNIPFMKDEPDFIIENKTGRDYCQIHLNALYDCMNGIYYDAEMTAPNKKMETGALMIMTGRQYFPKNSIIICDRGYVSYKLIADFNEKKQKFVIRCKDIDAKTSILRRFDLPDSEFDKTVSVTMTRSNVHYNSDRKKYALVNSNIDFPQIESWSAEDYELSYRVVRVKLDDESYETLIANLSEEEMPFDNMKELYHFRWNQEQSYLHLKHHLGMIYFNAKKLEGVLQEIYSSLIMFNIASVITNGIDVRSISAEKHAQNKKKEAHEVKANFALAITNIRLFLKGRISESGLIDRIKKYVIPIRPGRSFPRKMKPQSLKPLNIRLS
ncbi:IS4 family transposase [Sharpea azabuensis]|uniref:IS4 family transposase n=1 Tax=Sharpea azabuensis TaxID=322505 RepID=UPI001569538A|nr:IS4 family transposase [Sharpea azabuensis]